MITITSKKPIKEIQEEFTSLFPFLRIEFFNKMNHQSKQIINKIPNLLTLGNAHKVEGSVQIEILPCTTVKEFESDFEEKFGLHVKLYRKSGKLWQEITVTDNWTMRQQNKTGNEISMIINEKFSSN